MPKILLLQVSHSIFGVVPLADVTRFLAIELKEQATGRTILFSTGLPIEGLLRLNAMRRSCGL